MGFSDAIRMNSLFPGFQRPQEEQDPLTEYATRVLPIIHGEQDRAFGLNQKLMAQMRSQQQLDAGNAAAHPNVVFGQPSISPLDVAKLKQGEEKIQNAKTDKEGNLQFKQSKEQIDSANRDARTKIYGFKAMHPGMKIVATKGGNFNAIDPITGKSMDTGVATGSVSDEDKIQLTGEQQQNLEGTRETNREVLEKQRQGGRESLANINNTAKQDLQDNKPTPELKPNQVTTDRYNKAQQLLTENPNYADYIKVDPQTKTFIVTPPPATGFAGFGGSPEKDKANLDTFHKINESIYGTSSTEAKPTESDTVDMKNPDGKVGKVPKNKVQEATKAGYSVVK